MKKNAQTFNQDTANDPIALFFREISKVKDDDRSLILVVNGFMELLVKSLIKVKCKNGKRILDDSRSYPYSIKLVILNEIGIITDSNFKVFDWLRKLRNDAAHDPFFELKTEDVTYLQLTGKKVDFFNGLQAMIMIFWNEHSGLFFPIFAPSISRISGARE